MKLSAFFSLLIFFLICANNTTAQVETQPTLQLTTTIIDERYCGASDNLRLRLRLHYRNVGTQPLILYRYSTAIPRTLVSRSIDAAARREYAYDARAMINVIHPELTDEPAPNESFFVVLQPNEFYDINKDVYLMIYDGTDSDDEDGLRAGNYFLQIKVWTWYHTPQRLLELRERWSSTGYLWSETMTSESMPFTVASHQQVVDCSQ